VYGSRIGQTQCSTEVLVEFTVYYNDALKPVHTVAEKCDSRRISPLSRRFRHSGTFLRQCGQGFRNLFTYSDTYTSWNQL